MSDRVMSCGVREFHERNVDAHERNVEFHEDVVDAHERVVEFHERDVDAHESHVDAHGATVGAYKSSRSRFYLRIIKSQLKVAPTIKKFKPCPALAGR